MRYHWLTERSHQKNLTFIGDQDVKNSVIITQHIIQRNITVICADSYRIKQIVFRFCEGVLNYSHSRNPPCAPAWTHRQIQAPREPPN
jgi:ornithine carbamoyltransferase